MSMQIRFFKRACVFLAAFFSAGNVFASSILWVAGEAGSLAVRWAAAWALPEWPVAVAKKDFILSGDRVRLDL
jgi:hypothetical protein